MLTTVASERPRERLLERGADALANSELLAVILGSGIAGSSAAELGARVLEHAGSLAVLSRAGARELATVHGIGVARASRLAAAFQLGHRAITEPLLRQIVRSPSEVHRYLQSRLRGLLQEVFVVVALDSRSTILSDVEVARGSLTHVHVHPREVFRPLIQLAAAGAVVVHNHPSGDPTPSPDDVAMTRRLRRAGDLVGIPILDHIVIGGNGFVSIGDLIGAEDTDWEGEW